MPVAVSMSIDKPFIRKALLWVAIVIGLSVLNNLSALLFSLCGYGWLREPVLLVGYLLVAILAMLAAKSIFRDTK
jgi:hypothetical protein